MSPAKVHLWAMAFVWDTIACLYSHELYQEYQILCHIPFSYTIWGYPAWSTHSDICLISTPSLLYILTVLGLIHCPFPKLYCCNKCETVRCTTLSRGIMVKALWHSLTVIMELCSTVGAQSGAVAVCAAQVYFVKRCLQPCKKWHGCAVLQRTRLLAQRRPQFSRGASASWNLVHSCAASACHIQLQPKETFLNESTLPPMGETPFYLFRFAVTVR